ncbi:uncharacterized protein LOC134577681 [Pelobates fuscus]|uniref:uncharacterized protein LOC134577681 n=1 Tax=Pelobates fuscus TaxID=191477 RepID=UPI002FE46B55
MGTLPTPEESRTEPSISLMEKQPTPEESETVSSGATLEKGPAPEESKTRSSSSTQEKGQTLEESETGSSSAALEKGPTVEESETVSSSSALEKGPIPEESETGYSGSTLGKGPTPEESETGSLSSTQEKGPTLEESETVSSSSTLEKRPIPEESETGSSGSTLEKEPTPEESETGSLSSTQEKGPTLEESETVSSSSTLEKRPIPEESEIGSSISKLEKQSIQEKAKNKLDSQSTMENSLREELDRDTLKENGDLKCRAENQNMQENLESAMENTMRNVNVHLDAIVTFICQIPLVFSSILSLVINIIYLVLQILLYSLSQAPNILNNLGLKVKFREDKVLLFLLCISNYPSAVGYCEGSCKASDLVNQILVIRTETVIYCQFHSNATFPTTYQCLDHTAIVVNKTCLKLRTEEWPESGYILDFGKGPRGESMNFIKDGCWNSTDTQPVSARKARNRAITAVIIAIAVSGILILIGCIYKNCCPQPAALSPSHHHRGSQDSEAQTFNITETPKANDPERTPLSLSSKRSSVRAFHKGTGAVDTKQIPSDELHLAMPIVSVENMKPSVKEAVAFLVADKPPA